MGWLRASAPTPTIVCPMCATSMADGEERVRHFATHATVIPPNRGEVSGQFTWHCTCGPSGLRWTGKDLAGQALDFHLVEAHGLPRSTHTRLQISADTFRSLPNYQHLRTTLRDRAGTPPTPTVTQTDLTAAEALLDEWDAAGDAQDSSRTWACLERIGEQGGFPGTEAILRAKVEEQGGGPKYDIEEQAFQAPWRWFTAAARLGRESGDNVLTARIFLFMFFFEISFAPRMTTQDMASTGMAPPSTTNRIAIASEAAHAVRFMAPDQRIDGAATAGDVKKLAAAVASGQRVG